jgi:hypothetical protein
MHGLNVTRMELTISSTIKEFTMEKHSDQEEEKTEEGIQEGMIEFTSSHEYIASACNSINTIADIDTALMSKSDELRIKRIKRKSLRIIDLCIGEMYDELFESDDEE